MFSILFGLGIRLISLNFLFFPRLCVAIHAVSQKIEKYYKELRDLLDVFSPLRPYIR